MRWSGIPLPSVTSGAVTSIPNFTRSGRPSLSFASSPPSGSTWAALRVSSAMPMAAATLPLQSPASRAAFRPKARACEAAAQDPQAPALRPGPDPVRARPRLVHLRAGERNRQWNRQLRPERAREAGGRWLHLRRQAEHPCARGAARFSEPDHRSLGADLRPDEAGDRGRRGQALLRAPRRRRARDRPRRLAGPPQREGRRGRLDDHAAVRQEHLREPPALDRPEAEGGGDRLAARAALVEGPDPDRLPEHDLFREWRLWRRTGLTDLLPPQGRPDDLGRGGAPCRDPERPLAVRPGGRPEGGAGAAGHRPTRPVPAG